jgi:hypothetical protein
MINSAEREDFEKWVTTVWRPDDGEELLKKEFPRFAFAAYCIGRAQASGVPVGIKPITMHESPDCIEDVYSHEAFARGWNACRQAVIEATPTPPKSASVPVERLEALRQQWLGNAECNPAMSSILCEQQISDADDLAELIAEYKA